MNKLPKEYKRRRNIERATLYKVEYYFYLSDDHTVESREFNSSKSLSQWVDRNDNDNTIGLFILRKLALIDDAWEPYTAIGKKNITLSDLKSIVRNLGEDLNTSDFGR